MREKNGHKPCSRKKLKPNHRGAVMQLRHRGPVLSRSIRVANGHRNPAPAAESLVQQQDQLRNEIRHGEEYLKQLKQNLDESRSSLEQWNSYELISSIHPLDHLIETMVLQERAQQFLLDWLGRRQQKLTKLTRDLEGRIRRTPQAAQA